MGIECHVRVVDEVTRGTCLYLQYAVCHRVGHSKHYHALAVHPVMESACTAWTMHTSRSTYVTNYNHDSVHASYIPNTLKDIMHTVTYSTPITTFLLHFIPSLLPPSLPSIL